MTNSRPKYVWEPKWVWRDPLTNVAIFIVSFGIAYGVRGWLPFEWTWLGVGISLALLLVLAVRAAVWHVRHHRHWARRLPPGWRSIGNSSGNAGDGSQPTR